MRFYGVILLFMLSGFVHSVQDETDPYNAYRNHLDYDESLATPWIEREIQVEQLPNNKDLTEFPMDSMPANMRLFGDLANMTIGNEDRIIHLWLVAQSKQGAYNGTYEGIRCATGEYKVYAYANPKSSKPLRQVKLPVWRTVNRKHYRHELMRDFLCHDTLPRQPLEVFGQLDKDATQYDPSY